MSPTDDSLERVRKTQAERKESVRKLAKIKVFCRRNVKRFLVAGLFTIILSVLSLVPGVGFSARVTTTSAELLYRGHRCPGQPVPPCERAASSCLCILGWAYEGIIDVTFNPYFYPTNHLFGSEFSKNFTHQCEPSVSEASFKHSLITQTLLSELPPNIPLFYAVGFILPILLEKAIRKGSRK